MIRRSSACVCCGLPCTSMCIYYGRYDYLLVCDKCGDEVENLYEVDGEQLCEDCVKEKFYKDFICEDCGVPDDDYYEYDGKILCGNCLLKKFDKAQYEEE